MTWRYRFVHCVPVRIIPVAVHAGSSIRARDDASGVGQGITELDVGRISQGRKELIVGRHNDRTGFLGEGSRREGIADLASCSVAGYVPS
jgi:hypothetical protein